MERGGLRDELRHFHFLEGSVKFGSSVVLG
jgi:hypothetical protein